MSLRAPIVAASGLVLLALAPSGAAQAGNAAKPRIEPEFGEVACLAVVDRSEDPVFHLDYTIAEEDVGLTEDEPEDSRRHQFFAFPQQGYELPLWISEEDVAAADAVGLIDADLVPDDEILESSSAWPASTWTRLNADDARIPITLEAAAQGVDWDTSGVEAGTYVIAGYTWEPLLNVWTWRRGAVRVVDEVDPEVNPPSLYLSPQSSWTAVEGEDLRLEGCAIAPEGSAVHIAWARWSANHAFEWNEVEGEQEVENGAIELDFSVPRVGTADLVVRATLVAPDGEAYVAFTPSILHALEDLEEDDGEPVSGCAVSNSGSGLFVFALWVLLVGRRRQAR